MYKIGIYSKSSFFRSGMKQVIQNQDIAEFETLTEARRAAAIFRNLVLVTHESDLLATEEDIRLDDDRLKVVVIAPKFNLENLVTLFNMGARGYQLESVSSNLMQVTLQIAALGEFALPSSLAEHLSGTPKDVEVAPLSPKELMVLRCLAKGQANKEISRSLGIAEATTKVHVKAIMRKLGVSNRTQVAVWAVRNGFDRSMLSI